MVTYGTSPTPSHRQRSSEPPDDPLSSLPRNRDEVFFTSLKQLRRVARIMLDKFDENAIQYLVVRNIPPDVIKRIDDDKGILGVTFRFEFYEDERLGIIKLMPGAAHEFSASRLSKAVDRCLQGMNVSDDEMDWGLATTRHRSGTQHGKQPDQQFLPGSRLPSHGGQGGWPTLVIEVGVSESLNDLRRDARWWLAHADGAVRYVLVASIDPRNQTARLEKWELVTTASTPGGPMTRARATGQPLPRATQTISITRTAATGAPLTLNFQALMCRAPGPGEGNIVLNENTLLKVFRFLW